MIGETIANVQARDPLGILQFFGSNTATILGHTHDDKWHALVCTKVTWNTNDFVPPLHWTLIMHWANFKSLPGHSWLELGLPFRSPIDGKSCGLSTIIRLRVHKRGENVSKCKKAVFKYKGHQTYFCVVVMITLHQVVVCTKHMQVHLVLQKQLYNYRQVY